MVAAGQALALVQLGLVLCVLLGGALWLRGRGGPRGEATRSIRLSGEHAVHVIEVSGQRFLVGTGPGGAPSLLTELRGAPGVSEGGEAEGARG